MARTARQDYRGALQHVMVRGIEKRLIFLDDEDRHRFLFRLGTVVRETGTRCLAFAVMPNHFHLLLETGPTPLSQVMRRLGTVHAMDFNRRHERVGHLFQNRFKSKLVRNDGGLIAVVRYVHLNPVRAGLVPNLDSLSTYPWTGHAALMGRRRAEFLDASFVLSRFAADIDEARSALVRWMEAGLAPPDADGTLMGAPVSDGVALLSDDPPDPVDNGAILDGWRRRMRDDGWSARRVVESICARFEISPVALGDGRRSRSASRAREAIAGLASGLLGLSHVEVAREAGVSRQALEQALARFNAWDAMRREQVARVLGQVPSESPK